MTISCWPSELAGQGYPPLIVSQHQEHVQDLEVGCWHREEIDGCRTLDVILEKGSPRLRRRLPVDGETGPGPGGGTRAAGEKLCLSGIALGALLKDGRVGVTARLNGRAQVLAVLSRPDKTFELAFALPADLVGTTLMEVDLTSQAPPNIRDLSLRFGTLAIG